LWVKRVGVGVLEIRSPRCFFLGKYLLTDIRNFDKIYNQLKRGFLIELGTYKFSISGGN
jgi:hypothetical protein